LFIDEAYSLYDGKEGLFGDEAINTIVQEMENQRDDLVVIFAGYKNEMQNFLNRNSGLRSRIAYEIEFEDYSNEELMQIAQKQARDFEINISQCEDKIKDIIELGKKSKNFGNGRFVRSMMEKARMNQAGRLVREDKLFGEHLIVLKPEDFEIPKVESKICMGFN
jgi:AAA+ superfamily predicted ATPase